jgi:calcineurin-like phosphoesterase family protein
MNYFISDLHFGHKNCLAFDNRPFTTIEEHDEYIISSWNDTVGVDDDVYILGDISWYNSTKTIEIFSKLNGRLHLIKGNHDTTVLKNPELRNLFVEITDYKELFIDKDTSIVLCHYPIPCFKNHYYGWYHLYGHVHASFEWNMMENTKSLMTELYSKQCKMYNVGAMMRYIGYIPRTLEQIIAGEVSVVVYDN